MLKQKAINCYLSTRRLFKKKITGSLRKYLFKITKKYSRSSSKYITNIIDLGKKMIQKLSFCTKCVLISMNYKVRTTKFWKIEYVRVRRTKWLHYFTGCTIIYWTKKKSKYLIFQKFEKILFIKNDACTLAYLASRSITVTM